MLTVCWPCAFRLLTVRWPCADRVLVKVGTPMIYGIWDVGSGKSWAWATDVGHYWRTGPDLGTRWGDDTAMSVMLNYDLQQAIPSLDSISGPAHEQEHNV